MKPIIPVTKPSAPPLDEYLNEISDIWDTRMFTNIGSKVDNLEVKIAEYLGVPNVTVFSNGHSALEAAIMALELKGEVITTPFTFTSTSLSIVRNSLKPVFCDIKESDYTIDCDKIERLINENTCAILPVHIYGNICDHEKLDSISKEYNIPVIYDAAHAFGIKKEGVNIANFGDISMFSFHAAKVFHTVEGGALAYDDNRLKPIFNQIRNFGMHNFNTVRMGANFKMTEIHAAMGLCNLRHLSEYISNRQVCFNHYMYRLGDVNGLKFNRNNANIDNNYSYFPIEVIESEFGMNRDELCHILNTQNIFARKYYHPLVSQFPIYDSEYDIMDTPVAAMVSNRILTLPLYSDLKKSEIDLICDLIISASI